VSFDTTLNIASLLIALISLFQSKRASRIAKDVEEKILKNRQTSDLSRLSGCLDIAIQEIKIFAPPVLHDPILQAPYFYGRIPVKWVKNDDQEGLQPRVLDYKRLVNLRNHLRSNPQLAPAIARIVGSNILLFDGQHKSAAQLLNNATAIDVKVYVSPAEQAGSKRIFDALMMTNLSAHSKHRQVPFYTSTLLERLSVIYREYWEDFATTRPQDQHSESNFIAFLTTEKRLSRAEANNIFRAPIMENAATESAIEPYVAVASKDPNFPITQELLNKALYPVLLFLEPSPALFDTGGDFRNHELANFKAVAELIVSEGFLRDWVSRQKNVPLTSLQLKARRLWHKGSVLTWAPYLKDILVSAFDMMTEEERTKLLYRPEMTLDQRTRIQNCLKRLFNYTMWDAPEGQMDDLLVSAQKQDELFRQHNLTARYVLTGQP
jgi:hypothetical protein